MLWTTTSRANYWNKARVQKEDLPKRFHCPRAGRGCLRVLVLVCTEKAVPWAQHEHRGNTPIDADFPIYWWWRLVSTVCQDDKIMWILFGMKTKWYKKGEVSTPTCTTDTASSQEMSPSFPKTPSTRQRTGNVALVMGMLFINQRHNLNWVPASKAAR